MLKLGLTGSIATGKSTVLRAFADLGVPVFSSDDAVHELYAGEAVAAVEALFPGISHNGTIDRVALSHRLIGHPERLRALEAAVHPLVRQRMQKFVNAAASTGARLAVIDVPLLYETGFDYGLDKVAVTWVDESELRRRALARSGMTGEKLHAILARQLPQDEKARRADYVFDTGKPVAETRADVEALVRTLTSGTR
jgi:dephospho-CoA kinase